MNKQYSDSQTLDQAEVYARDLRYIPAHLLIGLVLFVKVTIGFSQKQVFVKEYTYQASESDSKVDAREKALDQIRLLVLQEIATYTSSVTELTTREKDEIFSQRYEEEIRSVTAGTTSTKILKESWDGSIYLVQAEVSADVGEIKAQIAQIITERSDQADLVRIEYDKLHEKAIAAFEIGQYEMAEQLFKQALEVADYDDEALEHNLASAIYQLALKKNGKWDKKKLGEGLEHLKRSLVIDPEVLVANDLLDLYYEALGDLEGRKLTLVRLVSMDKTNCDYLYRLQVVYRDLKYGACATKAYLLWKENSCHEIAENVYKAQPVPGDIIRRYQRVAKDLCTDF